MKIALRKGLSYGATSGVITSLGLLVGLTSATGSKEVLLAGLLTIAFADALSDGFGIHVSEESEGHESNKAIWDATLSTVFAKMLIGMSFIIPIFFLPLIIAIVIDFAWGIIVLSYLSYRIARQNGVKVVSALAEHICLALLVIAGSFAIGKLISYFLG
jgi:vacuolar iron transporter family protein